MLDSRAGANMTASQPPPPGASYRLILASASPRRAELLREHGYAFDVKVSPYEEPTTLDKGISPAAHAEALSIFKATSVADVVTNGLILAADTIAELNGCIFGKPADRDDARRILTTLAGTTHRVITAITLLDASRGTRLTRHATTNITMRPLPAEEIEAYLNTQAWEGKAGAYGIQDVGDQFVEVVDGSFTNVVGLPIELLSEMLDAWNATSGKK